MDNYFEYDSLSKKCGKYKLKHSGHKRLCKKCGRSLCKKCGHSLCKKCGKHKLKRSEGHIKSEEQKKEKEFMNKEQEGKKEAPRKREEYKNEEAPGVKENMSEHLAQKPSAIDRMVPTCFRAACWVHHERRKEILRRTNVISYKQNNQRGEKNKRSLTKNEIKYEVRKISKHHHHQHHGCRHSRHKMKQTESRILLSPISSSPLNEAEDNLTYEDISSTSLEVHIEEPTGSKYQTPQKHSNHVKRLKHRREGQESKLDTLIRRTKERDRKLVEKSRRDGKSWSTSTSIRNKNTSADFPMSCSDMDISTNSISTLVLETYKHNAYSLSSPIENLLNSDTERVSCHVYSPKFPTKNFTLEVPKQTDYKQLNMKNEPKMDIEAYSPTSTPKMEIEAYFPTSTPKMEIEAYSPTSSPKIEIEAYSPTSTPNIAIEAYSPTSTSKMEIEAYSPTSTPKMEINAYSPTSTPKMKIEAYSPTSTPKMEIEAYSTTSTPKIKIEAYSPTPTPIIYSTHDVVKRDIVFKTEPLFSCAISPIYFENEIDTGLEFCKIESVKSEIVDDFVD